MRRSIVLVTAAALCFAGYGSGSGDADSSATEPDATDPTDADSELVYGYISPGPDTWYQRDVDGFMFGAADDGVEVITLNSQYDVEQELANIDSLINQGVDGISMFSFNETGAVIAAQRAAEAGIPIVVTDSVGSVTAAGESVVASVDFDWYGMGVDYADWMAENHPGERFVILTGNLESVPSQQINLGMIERADELGKNDLAGIEDTNYSPDNAVQIADDLLASGEDFSIMFVMDEDMAGAVIRSYSDKGVLNDPITIISQNGSPAGIPLVRDGSLSYTISSSPGWEGLVAYLALHNNVIGERSEVDEAFVLPVIPVTQDNIDDPTKVVPWEPTDVYWDLTEEWFPELLTYKAD